jgi:ABC-type microcin C transport system permease subunit YejE
MKRQPNQRNQSLLWVYIVAFAVLLMLLRLFNFVHGHVRMR